MYLTPGHAELASQAVRKLYSGGVPKARTRTLYGGGRSHYLGSEGVRCSGLTFFKAEPSPGGHQVSANAWSHNQVDETTWVWTKPRECIWPGVGRHEVCSDPRRRRFHARACTLNAVRMMAGVPPQILPDQGHKIALGIRAVFEHLGEFTTPTEIAI